MENSGDEKKLKLKIDGMTCSSCEVLIEREFKKIPGVERAYVHSSSGKADVYCKAGLTLDEFQKAVHEHGYKVSFWKEESAPLNSSGNTKDDYLQIGSIFFFVVTAYLITKQMGWFPEGFGISENMSLSFIFMIGLVAAVSSCLAVVGGLLLAASAKYSEMHPHLSGFQKFKPHLYFNLGRLVSYTVLGGAVGLVGSTLTLSPKVNGVLIILVSIVMILLGLQLLKLFPSLTRFQPKMPKFIANRIYAMADGRNKSTPFVLGGLTFFLPCGFTQALQLYVLSQGDWFTGSLTMLMFSLGTLPALLSLSTVSSFAKGDSQKFLLKFAGVVVILIGTLNIDNGLILTGIQKGEASAFTQESQEEDVQEKEDALPEIVDGKQIVEMSVDGFSYSPTSFTVEAGIPVEWRIDGSGARGCASSLLLPELNIAEYLSPTQTTVIEFTPVEVGTLSFNCAMGMMSPGLFSVVENSSGIDFSDEEPAEVETVQEEVVGETDQSATSVPTDNLQKLSMEISNEKGFYPDSFTIKKNVPVELTMDIKVDIGGCMSVFMIPEFDVTQILSQGTNIVTFTPTKSGVFEAVCPMGILFTTFYIED